MDISQKIFEFWDVLGYLKYDSPAGACHGFIFRWIEACLLNQQDQFHKRKNWMLTIDSHYFSNRMELIKQKNRTQISLTSEERDLMCLWIFLDSLFAFQSTQAQQDIFGFCRLRDVSLMSQIASTEEIYQQGGLMTRELEVGNYSRLELESWLERYEKAIKDIDIPQNIFAFALSNEGHTIGLIYDKHNTIWKVEDVQNEEIDFLPSHSKEEIAQQIFLSFKNVFVSHQLFLKQVKFLRNSLQSYENECRKSNHDEINCIYRNGDQEIDVIYHRKIGKWHLKDQVEMFDREIMVDYLVLWFSGSNKPCPYINMLTTMVFIRDKENTKYLMQTLQQQLWPYEFSETWKKRSNVNLLMDVVVSCGHSDWVQHAIQMHFYDDRSLAHAIAYAAQENDIDIMKLFAALPNFKTLVNKTVKNVTTPLIYAIEARHVEMVKLLLCSGADPRLPDIHQNWPITMAGQQGDLVIFDCLMACHVDLNSRNSAGETAMSLAVEGNHMAIVKRLIRAGAYIHILSNEREQVSKVFSHIKDVFFGLKNPSDSCMESVLDNTVLDIINLSKTARKK